MLPVGKMEVQAIGGGYLCVKELRGNNQKVQVGKIMWNGEYLCVKELSRTIKQ